MEKNAYKSMLVQLKNWIDKIEPLKKKLIGMNIPLINTYQKKEEEFKIKLVKDFSRKNKPKLLADIGCNDFV